MWRYIHTRGQTFGPADLDRLLLWLREGRFGPEDWIWIDEESRWEQVKDCPDFKEVLRLKRGSPLYQATLSATTPLAQTELPNLQPVVRKIEIPDNLFEHELPGNRHYHRFAIHLPGRYCVIQPNQRPAEKDYHACRVINLSLGGTGIEIRETMEAGRTVRLLVDLADLVDEQFRVQARVVRTAPALEVGWVEHGLQFTNLPETDKQRLIDYLGNIVGV